jgi:DNA processing protein
VPGNITSRNSFGTNYLIKSAGAKLVQQWQDVVSELPQEVAARLLPPKTEAKGGRARVAQTPPDLSGPERAVFELLSTDEPAHIDALAEVSGQGVAELTATLLSLEMRELIRQLPGKCFVRRL